MANYVREVGTPTRVTSTGVRVLTSGNSSLIGISVATVLTGQLVQLWQGSATGTPIVGTMSMVSNTFYSLPAQCASGITYCVTNEDVDLTIYWNPGS